MRPTSPSSGGEAARLPVDWRPIRDAVSIPAVTSLAVWRRALVAPAGDDGGVALPNLAAMSALAGLGSVFGSLFSIAVFDLTAPN